MGSLREQPQPSHKTSEVCSSLASGSEAILTLPWAPPLGTQRALSGFTLRVLAHLLEQLQVHSPLVEGLQGCPRLLGQEGFFIKGDRLALEGGTPS